MKHGQGHAERPFHGGQCACDDCMSYDLTVTGYGTSMHYPYCKDRSCTGLPSATDHRPVPVRHDGVVLHPAQRARRPTPKRGLVVTDSTPATAGLPYDRKVLVDVLVYQHRKDIAGCGCGWAELGRSWPEHVATVYEESVRART